jgi:hypothetical protein
MKNLLSKLFKAFIVLIIALLAISFIGNLSLHFGFAFTGLMSFMQSNRFGFVLLQILVIAMIVWLYPKIFNYLLTSKLEKQEITWKDLPKANQENLLLFANRWVCLFVLATFFILGNM